MKTEELKNLFKEFGEQIEFEHDLKKRIGLTLEVSPKFFIKQTI